MKRTQYPTQAAIKAILDYDSETGILTWKSRMAECWPPGKLQMMKCITWNSQYAGSMAGTTTSKYVNIQFMGRNLRAHRLAWIYIHGDEPFGDIDHINRNKKDNRIANLRIADRSQNMRNYLLAKNSTSGIRGVIWNKDCFRWEAHIKINKEMIHLGVFKDFEKAVKARYAAEIKYGFTEYLPESTAYQYLQEA